MNKDQLLFAHALVVLPDKRVLLKAPRYQNSVTNQWDTIHKWSATIEKQIFLGDVPCVAITKAIFDTIGLSLCTKKGVIPETVMYPLEYVIIQEYNRLIFPFVVEINRTLTLKSNIYSQFRAEPFQVLMTDIMHNTIYTNSVLGTKHTINTVHVIKEVHLNNVFDCIPTKEAL